MSRIGDARTRPLAYRPGDSPLHRLAAGWKLLAATAIGALAIALHEPAGLLLLALALVAGYRAAGLTRLELWKDVRWLLLQGALVIGLTVALRGTASFEAGLRTALQLLLVFLPFALVSRTTATESLLASLRARLPEGLAFATGAALRLVPVLSREASELVEMQRLRGARLAARDLLRPGGWHDWLACIVLPMTVRAVEVANAAADAAQMRGVGRSEGAFPSTHLDLETDS